MDYINERSYHSETRTRTKKNNSKRQKIQLLQFKFKKAKNNLNQLKRQNNEDYNHLKQLMINSQRLVKIVHESRQKAKLLKSDSWEPKRRINKPFSSLEKKQELDLKTLEQPQILKNKVLQTHNQTSHNKINLKMQKERKQQQIKQNALIKQQIEQLSAQDQYSDGKSSYITVGKCKNLDSVSKQNSQIKNSIFFKSTRLHQSNITVFKKKVFEERENIQPYIVAVLFSMVVLFFIST